MRLFIFVFLTSMIFAACGDDAKKLAPVGEACDSNADCESDDCRQSVTGCHFLFGCNTLELPGGMCTTECTWINEGTEEELLQADCADGEQCLAPGGDPSATACFVGCESQDDCRDDWVCTPLSGFSTCLPPEDAARIVEDPSYDIAANPAYEAALY
jgi:hypothetical protein